MVPLIKNSITFDSLSITDQKERGDGSYIGNYKRQKYWFRLKTTIERRNLPIDTWIVGNEAY